MKHKISTLLFTLISSLSIMACNISTNSLTPTLPVEPVTGASLSLSFGNDIDSPQSETRNLQFVTISTGSSCRSGSGSCYSPDSYILGVRHFGIVSCQDAAGNDMICPGITGEEVEENLNFSAGENFTVSTLSTAINDYLIYEHSSANAQLGDSSDIETDPITTPALYSGLQFGLDFVVTQYPSDDASITPGSGVNGEEFVLYCMNENGCSNLTGYSSDYDGLSDGNVENGDVVFLDVNTGVVSYWDLDTETFSPIANGRPTHVLTQGSVSGHPRGVDGEVLYTPSFGSLPALNITAAMIANGNADDLEVVYSVEEAMSFVDQNGNGVIDPEDLASLEFGKFRINGLDVMAETFTH